MKLGRWISCIFVAASLLGAAGCYDRFTWNYSDFKELSGNDAILEESSFSEAERDAKLRSIVMRDDAKKQMYKINAGDSISITVYNNPDLSIGRTLVTTDGYIGMVLVGQLKVAGLTLEQASLALEEALSKYIRNPKVGISPLEIHSETATIVGAVNKSGMFTIANDMRLTDLFAMAGGAASRLYDGQTLEAADLSKAVFVRNGKILPVDFNRALEMGDPLHNLQLHKGDYIYIPAKDDSMVFLIGDVKSPQRRVWTKNMGLLELVAACGGLNETHWSTAIIIRGGLAKPKLYKVDLDGVLRGDKPNVALESGDIVYIPQDDISEYNVFIRKLFPTAQLANLISTPMFWYAKF